MFRKFVIPLICLCFLSACSSTEPQVTETFQSSESSSEVEVSTQEEVSEEETDLEEEVSPEEAAFAALYYYEEENLDRYLAYQLETGFSADEVAWRVNMNLDLEWYVDAELITDTEAMPLLVNKYFQLPDDYVPDNLVQLSSGRYLTAETKEAYDCLVATASEEGYALWECSAYRSIASQRWLYDYYLTIDTQEEVDSYSSHAGFSEHHTGRTVDLMTNGIERLSQFTGTEEAQWVAENAYRFGFVVRYTEENTDVTGYTAEAWHITYVGTLHALVIHELGIQSLEEYVAKYIQYTPEDFQFPETPAMPQVTITPVIPIVPSTPEEEPLEEEPLEEEPLEEESLEEEPLEEEPLEEEPLEEEFLEEESLEEESLEEESLEGESLEEESLEEESLEEESLEEESLEEESLEEADTTEQPEEMTENLD